MRQDIIDAAIRRGATITKAGDLKLTADTWYDAEAVEAALRTLAVAKMAGSFDKAHELLTAILKDNRMI